MPSLPKPGTAIARKVFREWVRVNGLPDASGFCGASRGCRRSTAFSCAAPVNVQGSSRLMPARKHARL